MIKDTRELLRRLEYADVVTVSRIVETSLVKVVKKVECFVGTKEPLVAVDHNLVHAMWQQELLDLYNDVNWDFSGGEDGNTLITVHQQMLKVSAKGRVLLKGA